MKILYVTTVGCTMNFFKHLIEQLIKEGHSVDIATNELIWAVPTYYRELGCKVHAISTSRVPLNKGNFIALKEIRDLVASEQYDIVHCHTPNASVITRLACRKFRKKNGLKVFYTAHGFHFYKGAPLKNWLFYYPIEKFCSRFTDKLITINTEDYEFAKNKFNAKEVHYVPGVGIDLSRFENVQVDRDAKRREIGVPEDAFLLLSIGELNENKNHQVIIKALAKLNNPKVHYAIAGVGDKKEYLLELAKTLGVSDQLHLLGYRKDIPELDSCADVFCLPSIREGLSVSLMEVMACRKPCVVSRIRGNIDLIDENGGCMFESNDEDDCALAIMSVMNGDSSRMGEYNGKKIQGFGSSIVEEKMKELYF